MFFNFGEYKLGLVQKISIQIQWQNSVLQVDYNFVEY